MGTTVADRPALTVLLAGLGGQGILWAGDVLAEAALQSGLDVKKSEIHGLSLRHGGVCCQVRLGDQLASPLCGHGAVDFLLALEMHEGLRHLPYLAEEGRALVNRLSVALTGSSPSSTPPPAAVADPRILWLEGSAATQAAGCPEALNCYMLGALSPLLPVAPATWDEVLERLLPGRPAEVNVAMFTAGRRAIRNLHHPALFP